MRGNFTKLKNLESRAIERFCANSFQSQANHHEIQTTNIINVKHEQKCEIEILRDNEVLVKT